MIDYSQIVDGETWELFARDLLRELGFYIESSPSRGTDGGKDLLAKESIKGKIGSYDFTWLVSCKHFSVSGKSVSETHEPNLLERIKSFNADGFIGFYSTIASSGLSDRLEALKKNGGIIDFQIFDRKIIENHLLRVGYSFLLMRYFPKSYKKLRPINNLHDKYLPLNCEICGKDLLKLLYENSESGNVVFVEDIPQNDGIDISKPLYDYNDIFWVCKKKCDSKLVKRLRSRNQYTRWDDIGDLVSPDYFLKSFLNKIENIRSGKLKFTDQAFEKFKYLYSALSQKTFRELTGKEKERARVLFSDISDYYE